MMAHLGSMTLSFASLQGWFEYYLATFAKRLDILLPFSILIATIRTLMNLQQRGELVAMLASGISKKTLLTPFLVVAVSSMIILYANYQWFMPEALQHIETFKDDVEKSEPKEIMLSDGSKLIYSSYDRKTKTFQDIFWIRSADELFHMKSLDASSTPPQGAWVDHVKRSSSGQLVKVFSKESAPLTELHFDSKTLKNSVIPINEQSLSQLAYQAILYFNSTSTKASEISATLCYKLTFPFMALLAFLAPAPFCLRFTRSTPLLMIYLIAISGLFSFNVLLQAAFVLGKSGVVAPYLAVGIPWAAVFYFLKRNTL
jgi:lipopolysaccharide export system permease protein